MFIYCHFPALKAFSTSPSNDSGVGLLDHLSMTFPSRPINHFSKFHLTVDMPMKYGVSFFNHPNRGSVFEKLTLTLLMTGNVTLNLEVQNAWIVALSPYFSIRMLLQGARLQMYHTGS